MFNSIKRNNIILKTIDTPVLAGLFMTFKIPKSVGKCITEPETHRECIGAAQPAWLACVWTRKSDGESCFTKSSSIALYNSTALDSTGAAARSIKNTTVIIQQLLRGYSEWIKMREIATILVLFCAVTVVLPAKYQPAKYLPKWKQQACELPSAQSENSHYICDENGEPKCLPGWQGDLCDVPICKKGCDPLQGYCKRPGECRCKMGFYGERCNKCIPLPGCQHGYCNQSFECICRDGWDGVFCTEPICRSDCHATRGFCEYPGQCQCRLGWAGPTCRSCLPLPGCQHGYCDKPLECKCSPGFTGLLCQTAICAPGCHGERGYCRRPGECRCKVGWAGATCGECVKYPGCQKGSCNKPWECNCETGWGGMLCDEELNYCEKNPDTCKNGGRCQSLESGDGYYRCHCPSGVEGRNCENMPTTTTITVTNETITTEKDIDSVETLDTSGEAEEESEVTSITPSANLSSATTGRVSTTTEPARTRMNSFVSLLQNIII
ncbi:hypothetical protein K1T71_008440 [Dendrolimus kikuchii]|uniref:Uncharacterized protein n=1 Tax=Dendrolimus kikuchii TaxID=765133 RepID=A0ACC1CX43_9NEOP|nr:hypothetical protein K1T71_008440 [Dendrolimus kikuchii]